MNAFYQERLFLFPPQINFVFLNTWGRLQLVYSFYSVLVQFNQKTFFLIFVFSHSKRGTTTAKQKIAISNVMRRTVTSCCFYRKLTWCSFLTDSQNITLWFKRKHMVQCRLHVIQILTYVEMNCLNAVNINWRDVQTKNVANNVDMSCLRAPWPNGPYKN